MILVTISGTWGARKESNWFNWDSDFWALARKKGLKSAKVPIKRGRLRPRWDTRVDGIWGKNESWEAGAQCARSFINAYCDEDTIIVAHSHGGQVAAIALAEGLPQVKRLVTVGTPVRADLEKTYQEARAGLVSWHHLYSNQDWMQFLGSLFDGSWRLRRKMENATNLLCSDQGHSEMLNPHYWEEKSIWETILNGS